MQGTAEELKSRNTLNSCVATSCPVPDFSETVGELVDVLVQCVFPSESGVACQSKPRLMTTQRYNIFDLQGIDLDFDTVPSVLWRYLYIKRWANDGVVIINPNLLASFCIHCTRVLSADRLDALIS